MSLPPESSNQRQAGTRTSQRGILRASALTLGRVGRRVVMGLSILAGVLLLLAALAWGVLLLQILPRIDSWRFDLAEQATQAIGVPVRIGKVVGRADGIWPTLSLREVQLLDAAGRVALRLPEVTARVSLSTLSPRALADGELRLDRLVIVGPELDVRRDTAGQWHVAGLKIASSGGQGGSAAADWVLSQARIQIQQGTIRWTDELIGAPTLALKQLDLVLRNRPGLGRRLHELTVSATPPAEFGQRFKVSASMSQPLWLASGVPVKDGESVPIWQRWELDATRPSQWQTWSGSVSATLPFVDVQRLKQHVKLPVDVEGGRGAAQATLDLTKGLPSGLKLDVAMQDVNVRLARGLAPLAFRHLDGQVAVSHESESSALSFQKLSFQLSDGLVWPASSGSLVWRHGPWPEALSDAVWGLTRGGEAQADRLDLNLLARLVDRLPLAPKLRATLADIAPHGVVEQLQWNWEGLLESPTRYKASGRVRGLGWASSDVDSRPGMEQATVSLSADENGGHADLDVKQGWIAFPGVFEEPRIPLNALQAKVSWTITPARVKGQAAELKVDVSEATFANADASGQLEGHWRTGSGVSAIDGKPVSRFPGVLSLTGRLDRADASKVWRYLPLAIPKAPRDYVRLALRSGQGEKVSFDVEGDLNEFPFKDDQGGRFRVKVPMRNVSLDYVPQGLMGTQADARQVSWPPFTSLEGLLLFEGQRLLIKEAKGRLGGVGSGAFGLRDVEGRIDDLGHQDPHLTIKGQGEGPLNDMLRFLSASPIGRWTSNVLGAAQSKGTAAMRLSLDIPLDHADDTRLQGTVTMLERDGASLRLNPSVPLFAALQGTIGFTETDLNVKAKARVWGHAVDVDGRRTSDGVTRFVAQGSMSAEGLRQAVEIPFLQKLAQRFNGESPVTVNVTMGKLDALGKRALPEVQITSNLQGMATNLPAPLNKPASSVWPLKVTHRQEDAQGLSDAIVVDLGNPQTLQMTSNAVPWLRVDLRRDTSGDQARVTRGLISLVQAGLSDATGLQALPAKGVAAQIAIPALDLDAWSGVAGLFKSPEPVRGAGADASESYLPDSVTVKTSALTFQQRTLKDVSGTLAHPSAGVWRAQLDAQQVAGLIEWVPEVAPVAGGAGGSRVVARLSRLSVPAAEAQALEERAAEQMLSPEAASGSMPALDVVIDQLEWRGLPLGRLEVEAVNRQVPVAGAAPVPEWRMTKLRMSSPEAQLNASGNWTVLGAQSAARRPGVKLKPRSAFSFTLDLQNSGGLLTRLGLPQTIKGGKGKLTGQVSWLGAPMEPDPLSMTGDINVQISEGQFLKVDPGMAKLLGVLSLQSLPRRLTLDFRDVFQQGFAFDSIDGDVKIGQGQATTRNLRMRGVQAVVLMEGQADLAHETQNLHVYVVPEVNAGGASLAYAAINPVIGLGTFIAQVLLRKQVSDAGTQEFRVTGPWADPQVEKVGGKGALAASAPDGGVASSGATVSPAPVPAVTPPASVTKPRKPS
ncbi:MAG TPA: YhdP family protein [Aquabacterium sp.]|uniref:YhdP family protein n=1 Tax=Aquabacterium sp. TaxID=1872578 RepID=UPI002E2FBB8B|nr:YhdP family protein [Aquabacterium sp.]HEX5355211.1 YhdP family protein [Aquabacterium sp.]